MGIGLADAFLLFFAGMMGAAVNAIAGGGTFFTFPAFLSTGVAAVIANASNAVAIWPGRLLAIVAYAREVRRQGMRALVCGFVCLLGGAAGAWALMRSGDRLFLLSVPWLMLAATVLFLFDRKIAASLALSDGDRTISSGRMAVAMVPLFLCAMYGGFFGGGLGVVMLPILSLTGVRDIQELNGLKNLLVAVVTSMAVLTFILGGVVAWPGTIVMAAGALIGGYYGGYVARLIPSAVLRRIVVAVGFGLSGYYFWKIYLA